MKTYYTYLYTVEGTVKYIGTGTMDGGKYSRAYDIENHNDDCRKNADSIDVIIAKANLSFDEKQLEEALLIRDYGLDNLWNKRHELTENKMAAVFGLLEGTTVDYKEALSRLLHSSFGSEVGLPASVAAAMVDAIPNGDYKNILVVSNDGFGGVELLKHALIEFGNRVNYTFVGSEKACTAATLIEGMKTLTTTQEELFKMEGTYDLIIMNPPFGQESVVKKFIQKGIDLLVEGGKLVVVAPLFGKQFNNAKYIVQDTLPEAVHFDNAKTSAIWGVFEKETGSVGKVILSVEKKNFDVEVYDSRTQDSLELFLDKQVYTLDSVTCKASYRNTVRSKVLEKRLQGAYFIVDGPDLDRFIEWYEDEGFAIHRTVYNGKGYTNLPTIKAIMGAA